jgi:hypothetical protein
MLAVDEAGATPGTAPMAGEVDDAGAGRDGGSDEADAGGDTEADAIGDTEADGVALGSGRAELGRAALRRAAGSALAGGATTTGSAAEGALGGTAAVRP